MASLPARGPEIDAATSRVGEAEAQLAQAKEKLSDLSPVAPADAMVDDVFFKPGEWVAAGQPVVSLLKPSDVTLRFFVPEAHAGAGACPAAPITLPLRWLWTASRRAVITHVASQPEYTPPVIYSESARGPSSSTSSRRSPTRRIRTCARACPSRWSRCNDDARHRRQEAW